MKLGLVGLGRMGANMSRRWLQHGPSCWDTPGMPTPSRRS